MFEEIFKFFAKQKVLIMVGSLTLGVFGTGFIYKSIYPDSKELESKEQIITQANVFGLSEHFKKLFKEEVLLFVSKSFLLIL